MTTRELFIEVWNTLRRSKYIWWISGLCTLSSVILLVLKPYSLLHWIYDCVNLFVVYLVTVAYIRVVYFSFSRTDYKFWQLFHPSGKFLRYVGWTLMIGLIILPIGAIQIIIGRSIQHSPILYFYSEFSLLLLQIWGNYVGVITVPLIMENEPFWRTISQTSKLIFRNYQPLIAISIILFMILFGSDFLYLLVATTIYGQPIIETISNYQAILTIKNATPHHIFSLSWSFIINPFTYCLTTLLYLRLFRQSEQRKEIHYLEPVR
jgi:hypothetical protein